MSAPQPDRADRVYWEGGVVFGAALLFYVATAAPDIVGHDDLRGPSFDFGDEIRLLGYRTWDERGEPTTSVVAILYRAEGGRLYNLPVADQDGHLLGEVAVIGEVLVK